MEHKYAIVCFTDLKGSTDLTNTVGNEGVWPYIQEFLGVGKSLAEIMNGAYVKDVGDSHMLGFDEYDKAMQFACCLQQYYAHCEFLRRPRLRVRIGIHAGPAMSDHGDLFGATSNKAARVESGAEPGFVNITESLRNEMVTVWGNEKCSKYFASIGKHKFKGFEKEEEVFTFNWQLFGAEEPAKCLAGVVHAHLNSSSVELSNLSVNDLRTPGLVIWPVVPRKVVTAIHRGQIEAVRLLLHLGWRLRIVLVDCGAQHNVSPNDCVAFKNMVLRHAQTRGLVSADVDVMSEFYEPARSDYQVIQRLFRRVTSELTVQDLLAMNDKGYSEDIRNEVRMARTLDFLRPSLASAAVLYLAEKEPKKSIVIAGADEKIQWEQTFLIGNARDRIGVLMNPVLRTEPSHQARQRDLWPIWHSVDSLEEGMSPPSNLAWWTFRLHAFLPGFPSKAVNLSGNIIRPEDWESETALPAGLSARALSTCVWRLLDPNATT